MLVYALNIPNEDLHREYLMSRSYKNEPIVCKIENLVFSDFLLFFPDISSLAGDFLHVQFLILE